VVTNGTNLVSLGRRIPRASERGEFGNHTRKAYDLIKLAEAAGAGLLQSHLVQELGWSKAGSLMAAMVDLFCDSFAMVPRASCSMSGFDIQSISAINALCDIRQRIPGMR
jgi:hypothetical protein